MASFGFAIPALPPSVNNLWGIKKNGQGLYKTKQAQDFELLVGYSIRSPKDPFETDLIVQLQFVFANKNTYRKRDVDNMAKPVLDALEKMRVFKNDNQVIELRLIKTMGEVDQTIGVVAEIKTN